MNEEFLFLSFFLFFSRFVLIRLINEIDINYRETIIIYTFHKTSFFKVKKLSVSILFLQEKRKQK